MWARASQYVRDLQYTVTAVERGFVSFRLPVRSELVHYGGVLCGQAIMSAMDTGMVMAVASMHDGEFPPMGTVQLQVSFLRSVPEGFGDATFEARILKRGRSLVFGEVELRRAGNELAAHATTTYALL